MFKLLLEGVKEKAAEAFLKKIIKGTEWEGKLFIAGGYVRDELMGKDSKDIDIVVDKDNGGIEFAEWITKKMGNYKKGSNPIIYPKFGTAKFDLKGKHDNIDLQTIPIETVMPRGEKYEKGSRKPSVHKSDLKGDAERRDLTINTLFKNVSTGKILDLTGKGKADIKDKILRTPTDPDQTFKDDPLRMLRLIRFYARYDYKIPLYIIRSLNKNADKINDISKERIRDELDKIITVSNPSKALKLLKITKLLQYIIPEFKDAVGMKQNKHHDKDVWGHTIDVVKNTSPDLIKRLIALFHDIGKTVTKSVTPEGGVHFYGHEDEGKKIAIKVLKDLKYPNEIVNSVALGVAYHMKLKHGGDDSTGVSDKTLRKFEAALGDSLEHILDVIHADNISHAKEANMPNQIKNVHDRLKSLKSTESMNPTLPIDGHDLIKLGLQGKSIGMAKNAIQDAWYENPKITKKEAIKIATYFI